MKRVFKVDAGYDFSLMLEIDTTIMTTELATEINEFWSGAKDVLKASNGDVIEAVARRATSRIIQYIINGFNVEGALDELGKQEGWPEKHGISITDYDMPDFDADSLDVTELSS